MIDENELTSIERRAIAKLGKLAASWPKSLSLFSNAGSLEVHRNDNGEPYTDDTYILDIYGIRNDGGDRD